VSVFVVPSFRGRVSRGVPALCALWFAWREGGRGEQEELSS